MIPAEGDHILIIGDSITDAGRTVAEPYGAGYVSLLHALATAAAPGLGLRWTNRGVGGDTVRDLAARWQTDAVDPRPDVLCVMIGINDCWRGMVGRPEAVPVAEYRDTLAGLLRRSVEATGCRLVVATPYLIDNDPDSPWRASSDEYAAASREVAADLGAALVDVQAAFDEALRHSAPEDWAQDRVHPGLPGHAVIARAFLGVLGVPGALGEPSARAEPAGRAST